MKIGRGVPPWGWVVAAIVVVIGAVVVLALLRDADSAGTGAADVTLEAIAEEPGRFYGESVTISGEVFEVLGRRSFLIGERLTGELVVVSPVPLQEVGQSADRALSQGDTVWVSGDVRRFDVAEAEQEVGADLNDEALDAYVGTTAIIAESVSLEQPE